MIKVIRKYNKYILVGGMSLLMIAFLIPQGIQQLSDPRKRTVAYLGDEKITMGKMDDAQKEYYALERYSPALVKSVLGVEGPEHWLLLSHEAERAGFIGEAGDGTDWGLIEAITVRAMAEEQFQQYAQFALQQPQIAQQLVERARGILPRMRHEAMAGVGMSEPVFNRTVSKARGVYRMMEALQRASRYSDRRATFEKKEQLDAVFADAAVVPALLAAATVSEPSGEEIAAHFEKFKTTKTGEGDHGIGYTLPARLKLEWLTLDRVAIEQAITVDPVEANKRWRTSRTKFPGEFSVEKANVERELRAEEVTEIMDAADRALRAELKKASGRLENDKSYKKLPDDWASKRPKLEAVAQLVVESVKAATGFSMPLPPVTVKAANWVTLTDLAGLPEVGQSTVRSGAKSVPFPQIAFSVKELRSAETTAADFGLQVGLTSADLFAIDNEGRRYYFTVLDSRLESPADSLDEVKDKVVEDIKRLKAYETLLADAEDLKAAAAAGGVDGVSKAVTEKFPRPADAPALPAGTEVTTYKNVVFLKDDIANGDPRMNTKELRDAVRIAAAKLDPVTPGTDVPAADRTLVLGLPKSLAVAVVQLVQNRPLTAEKSRQVGERAIEQLQVTEFRTALDKLGNTPRPFSKAELTARLGYKPERGADEQDPDQTAAPAQEAKKGA